MLSKDVLLFKVQAYVGNGASNFRQINVLSQAASSGKGLTLGLKHPRYCSLQNRHVGSLDLGDNHEPLLSRKSETGPSA